MRAFVEHAKADVLAYHERRVDDVPTILETRVAASRFVVGDAPTVVDLSMGACLRFPPHESGDRFDETHPEFRRWLDRIAGIPGWAAPYDLLPGRHLPCYV